MIQHQQANKKPNILLVEDMPSIASALRTNLSGECNLMHAKSLEHARLLLPREEWSSILYDVRTSPGDRETGYSPTKRANKATVFNFLYNNLALTETDSPVIAITTSKDSHLEMMLAEARIQQSRKGSTNPAPYSFLRYPSGESIQRMAVENAVAHYLAGIDPITGLVTERKFRQRLETALQTDIERRAYARPTVLMGDLDGFKEVNDIIGYDAGNNVLRTVGAKIKSIKDARVLATSRFRGDEFYVLLDEPFDKALEAAHKLCTAINSEGNGNSSEPMSYIRISMGVAVVSQSTRTPNDLLEVAELMMKQSKKANKEHRKQHQSGGLTVYGMNQEGFLDMRR